MTLTPVAILAYYFPPRGGAGTQRFGKFAKWLPSLGYRPVVVTSEGGAPTLSAPIVDESLMEDVPREAAIYRVPDYASSSRWSRLVDVACFRLDFDQWVTRAEPVLLGAIEETGARALITTVSPYAAAQLGARVRRRLGLPWILDLRDPWALDEWRVRPTRLHTVFDRSSMKRALRRASLVIANTPAAKAAYVRLAGLSTERIWTIPNGFDPSDFVKPDPGRRAHFVLAHVGTLHDPEIAVQAPAPSALRTGWTRIEPTGRSARYLFEAVARLKAESRHLYDRLEVRLCGNVHRNHHHLATRLGISGVITELGYRTHAEALTELQAADMVFVPLHGLPPGDRPLVVPAKLYEALASEKPVLGCLPPGDGTRLIELTHGGFTCAPHDVGAIAAALASAVEAWCAGRPLRGASRSCLLSFSRQRLSERLAMALDRALGSEDLAEPVDPWEELAARPSAG